MIKTSHGIIETPSLLPVCALTYGVWDVFLERKVETPWDLCGTALFSLEYIRDSKYDVSKGIHSIIGDFPVFVDSGGFQAMKKGINRNPIEVLRFQERLGADVAFTFDFPIRDLEKKEKNMKMSIESANKMLQAKKRKKMLLYAAVHGFTKKDIAYYVSNLEDGFDGAAVGSLVPKKNNFELISDIVFWVKEIFDKPIHVFGVTGFPILYALSYLGVDTFDSWTYLVASAYKEYIHPEKLTRVKSKILKGNFKLPPCNCFVCKNYKKRDFLVADSYSQALLALHNLSVFLKELNLIKEALRENSFEELVLKKNKRIQKAFNYVSKKFYFNQSPM